MPNAPARSSIGNLAQPELMKAVWRRIRKQLRLLRFSEFDLAHDPLEWLGVDWDAGAMIEVLCRELQSASYRTGSAEIVRIAKSVGLTRPKAHPSPRDLLVYRLIVSAGESALLENSKPWTRFGRADADDESIDTTAESGWFRDWLRRQGQLWTITEHHGWLVETDIANFFPSVPLPALLEHVLANSNLGEDVVRLLDHMLRQFAPLTDYRRSAVVGLPQDNFNCSRILAHTFLKPLDDEFQAEGENNRFSRWVDDIVIGTDSKEEALRIVNRAQTSLEKLGLYPNTAKTRIIEADAFTADYMKGENDYLGEVEERYKAGIAEDMAEFRRRLTEHLAIGQPKPKSWIAFLRPSYHREPKPKAWNAILRRYYSLSRRLRDETLLDHAIKHIDQSPDSLRHILEYLATFPLERERLDALIDLLRKLDGLYEDVELLACEYICVAPNDDSDEIRTRLSQWALEMVERRLTTKPRLAAGACLVVGKFGKEEHIKRLTELFRTKMTSDSVVRQQTTIVLLGAGAMASEQLPEIVPHASLETSQHLRFIRSVVEADDKAVGMSLSLLEPIKRKEPARYVSMPRMLFLAPLLRKSAPTKVAAVEKMWKARLQGNQTGFADGASERWLGLL